MPHIVKFQIMYVYNYILSSEGQPNYPLLTSGLLIMTYFQNIIWKEKKKITLLGRNLTTTSAIHSRSRSVVISHVQV
jgi:hypothetical protein